MVSYKESLPHNVVDESLGALQRPWCPAEQDEDLGENLERAYQRDDKDKEYLWSQQGDSHLPPYLETGGSIDSRCLIVHLIDTLQPGKKDDRLVTNVTPDAHDDHRRHGKPLVSEPVDQVNTEEPQEVIQESVLPIVEPPPDHGNGDEWGDVGEKIRCTGERKESQAFVEEIRH